MNAVFKNTFCLIVDCCYVVFVVVSEPLWGKVQNCFE